MTLFGKDIVCNRTYNFAGSTQYLPTDADHTLSPVSPADADDEWRMTSPGGSQWDQLSLHFGGIHFTCTVLL